MDAPLRKAVHALRRAADSVDEAGFDVLSSTLNQYARDMLVKERKNAHDDYLHGRITARRDEARCKAVKQEGLDPEE